MKKQALVFLASVLAAMLLAAPALAADTVVSRVNLTYDKAVLDLNAAWTEGEVQTRARQTMSAGAAGGSVDLENCYMLYLADADMGDLYGVGDGSGQVSAGKEYYLQYELSLESGFDWPEGIKAFAEWTPMTEYTGMKVYVNGALKTNGYFKYNPYWNYLSVAARLPAPSADPIVTGVSIAGSAEVSVAKGSACTFSAAVTGTVTDKSVKWTVTGGKSTGTKITAAGKLTVGGDETAKTLTVKAAAKADTSKTASVAVKVTAKAPTITKVTVTSNAPDVFPGTYLWFEAKVTGTQTDKSVKWTVKGAQSADTVITEDGVLKVGWDEKAESLTVRAAAVKDTSKYGQLTVAVKPLTYIKKLALSYDPEKIHLCVDSTEGEAEERIRSNYKVATKGCELNTSWCLSYYAGCDMSGIGGGANMVSMDKQYYLGYIVRLQGGYNWAKTIRNMTGATTPMSAVPGFSVTVNKTARTDLYLRYDEINNWLRVYVPVKVTRIDLSGAAVTGVKDKTYTGKVIRQDPMVTLNSRTLTAGTDYKVTYSNNKKAGTASMKITGVGGYTGVIKMTFTIKPVKVGKAVLEFTSAAYTGKLIKPGATVTATVAGDTVTLAKGTDFKLTYANNKNAGTATATVTGIGNFTGTIKKSFTIKPVKILKATLEYTKAQYTGKALKPAVTVTAKVDGELVTLKKGTDYTVTYANNKNVGTATVTVTGVGNFKGTIVKTFKIVK